MTHKTISKKGILTIRCCFGTFSTFNIKGMISPVICSCGKVYDLTTVKVVHRYADCTQFRTPCCKKLADDREYKSMPDFERIDLKGAVLVEN